MSPKNPSTIHKFMFLFSFQMCHMTHMTICWTCQGSKIWMSGHCSCCVFFSQVFPMFFDSKARSRPPSVSSQMTPPRYSLKGCRCSNQKRQMKFGNNDEIWFIWIFWHPQTKCFLGSLEWLSDLFSQWIVKLNQLNLQRFKPVSMMTFGMKLFEVRDELCTRWFQSDLFIPYLEVTYLSNGSLNYPKKGTTNCQYWSYFKNLIQGSWTKNYRTNSK